MTCIFCDYDKNDVVHETENFYIKIGKAIITAGHVMIIPKKLTIEEITKKFCKPFLMEHGAFLQSVFHAHIHLIPISGNGYSNVDFLNERLIPSSKELDFKIIEINNFTELQEYFSEHKKYLYHEIDDKKYIIEPKDILENNQDKVGYRHYFDTLGLKGIGNWRTMSPEDKELDKQKFTETLNKLFK